MAQNAKPAQLKPPTLKAFGAYIHEAEAEIAETLRGRATFLWSDLTSERARAVDAGQVVAQFWSGQGPVKVPNGLIHDWIGAALIPGTTVKDTLALIQDYDNHKNTYRTAVIASRTLVHE